MDEDLDIHSQVNSDSDDGSDSTSDSSDEECIAKLERDTLTWLMYCRAAGSLVHQYIQSSRRRIRRFENARSGRVFMITALEEDPNIAFCEFRMYPPMFVHFTHILRDEYELQSSQDVDIYEQVGMFLFILAHGKGYRQVRTLFGHSLQTIHHYFGVVLRTVVKLGAKIIKPKPNYNDSPPDHRPCPTRHPYFQTAVVVATMAIHNFLRREGQLDEAFQTVEEVVDAGEIDLPDEEEEIAATNFAPHVRSNEWDQLRDHITQSMR
ncbi:DDE Tnp4 domain-containing protein [Abeliophyllum distichum]|uniref:DDE Tnp4 domain-containing protein n=1 Tax=Abeliophyllum distichum TaxID=126358 RepID=A0ABD1RR45_9LAMI